MINLSCFNHLPFLDCLNSVMTDQVQLFIPCPVTGKEEEILRMMHYSVIPSIRSELPRDWDVVGYGISSAYIQKLTQQQERQGVDVLLNRKYGLTHSSGTTEFELLDDLSLKEIQK